MAGLTHCVSKHIPGPVPAAFCSSVCEEKALAKSAVNPPKNEEYFTKKLGMHMLIIFILHLWTGEVGPVLVPQTHSPRFHSQYWKW